MSEPSPETHVYVGDFRPKLSDVLALHHKKRNAWDEAGRPRSQEGGVPEEFKFGRGFYICPLCGDYWISQVQYVEVGAKKCLDAGHLDTPVYSTIEEVLKIKSQCE